MTRSTSYGRTVVVRKDLRAVRLRLQSEADVGFQDLTPSVTPGWYR